MKKNRTISLYWKCQFIGWSVASLYWAYLGYSGGRYNIFIGLLQFLSDVFVYIAITHLYRNFAVLHKWQQLSLGQLIPKIIPATFILGLAYLLVTIVKSYLFKMWLSPDGVAPFIAFFKLNWAGMLMAGIRLMAIWLLAYHLYHYAQREISIAKENARLAIITKDTQLSNLSTQLNPHFLFNSLNNIKALVIENPKSARRAIDLLSDLLRTSLYNGDILLTTVKDELSLVNDYFELEKLRLEERLQFHITAENGLGDALIPRFSIQTLAENAIKHGIARQKNGGLVSVKIAIIDDFINISVQNPGRLNVDARAGGLGIKNLSERLAIQYKGKAKFDLINDTEGNVLSTIYIPCS